MVELEIMFYSISENKKISQCYKMFYLKRELLFTFIIDEDFIVRYMSINDIFLGRNIDEFLRIY